MPRKRRKRRPNHVVRMILVALLIGCTAYLIRNAVGAWTDNGLTAQSLTEFLGGYRFAESIRSGLFAIAIAGWVFIFGSAIGSFLNVVVYRMPRGESLNKRASHCQFCDQPIRLCDNLPLLGWINLRGRCRVCRLPISSRYPVVEFITGAAFLFFFLYEVGTGGKFLPFFEAVKLRDGIADIFGRNRNIDAFRPLLRMYAIHILVLATLWPAWLIERDRNRVPLLLLVVPMLVNLVAVTIWPSLLPADWFAFLNLVEPDSPLAGIARHFSGPIGWFAGLALGLVIGSRMERSDASQQSRNDKAVAFSIACGLVGATFGWQTVFFLSLPLVVIVYFARAFQTHADTGKDIAKNITKRFDRFGTLLLLVVGIWVCWKLVFTEFHEATCGVTWLISGVLAVLIVTVFRYPQGLTEKVFQQVEQQEVERPVSKHDSASMETLVEMRSNDAHDEHQ